MAAHNATIAQTLGAITQASTGSTLTQTVVVTADVADTLVTGDIASISSFALASSAIVSVVSQAVTETADAAGDPTFDVITSLHETADVSESLGTAQTTLLDTGQVRAREVLAHSFFIPLTDAADASNTITLTTGLLTTSTAIALGTVVSPGITYAQLEAGVAEASSQISTGLAEALDTTADATGTPIGTTTALESLAGEGNVADTTVTTATLFSALSDSITVSESTAFDGSTANNALTGTAEVSERLWAKDLDAIAWILNTQSGGITNYDNFGFTSLAFHSGTLYATSPEGVFELGADDDDGRSIDAVIKGGFLDFGTEEKKRMSDIYVGYTGGDLECDVETYDGPEEVYTYEMEQRDAAAPRNNRLKVGRGLSSRYWRLAFRNIGGADFQIHDVAVEIAKSKRRL
ncbi:MAG: hypothetical protein KAJ19_21495 [Gammaproteobacteria bacterium]|nr:hypothetical protein [Gammaproteobacteria bacterium]